MFELRLLRRWRVYALPSSSEGKSHALPPTGQCPAMSQATSTGIYASFPQSSPGTIEGACPAHTEGAPTLQCNTDGSWSGSIGGTPCTCAITFPLSCMQRKRSLRPSTTRLLRGDIDDDCRRNGDVSREQPWHYLRYVSGRRFGCAFDDVQRRRDMVKRPVQRLYRCAHLLIR